MKRTAWIFVLMIVYSGLVCAQSINVSGPPADTVWFKGEQHVIAWTHSGSVSAVVNIVLVDPKTRSVRHNIALNTPNDGLEAWNIPLNIPDGKYRIVVKAKGQDVMGISPGFFIRMKRSGTRTPPPPTQRSVDYSVTITRPKSGIRWNFGGTEDILVETDFDAQYFKIELTSQGKQVYPIHEGAIQSYAKVGHVYKYRKKWTIDMNPEYGNGYFRVRVKATSIQGEVEGLSDSFYLSEDVSLKKVRKILKPVLIRNRHSRRREDYEWQWATDERDVRPSGEFEEKPDLMRLGFNNEYRPPTGGSVSWWYIGFIFRSQIIFSFDEIKDKIRLPISANLFLQKNSEARYNTQLIHGAGKLYVLTAPWDGRSIETPGYFYKDIPQKSGAFSIDVLQQVKDWLNGTEENLGFLVTAAKEDFAHNDEKCCTFFVVWLSIEYYEEE